MNTNPGCLPKFLHRLGLRDNPKPAPRPIPPTAPLQPPPAPEPIPYRLRDDFLSNAEASFYRVLKTVVTTHLLICPKVSLDDIFFVSHPERNQSYLNKINRKHVDFVVCDPASLKPMLGIELDDASHRRADRVERDEFVNDVFAAAGLPLLRVPAQATYSPQELTRLLQNILAPAASGAAQPVTPAASPTPAPSAPPYCPKCGVPMVLRTAQRGDKAGSQFYGCPNYPQCRQIIQIP